MRNDITIRQALLDDLDLLIQWRMEVLHCVFSIPADADTSELRQQNIDYYRKALANGSHIACFAVEGEAVVGCGGLCLYDEMPSPDNPTGHCAYLMNTAGSWAQHSPVASRKSTSKLLRLAVCSTRFSASVT